LGSLGSAAAAASTASSVAVANCSRCITGKQGRPVPEVSRGSGHQQQQQQQQQAATPALTPRKHAAGPAMRACRGVQNSRCYSCSYCRLCCGCCCDCSCAAPCRCHLSAGRCNSRLATIRLTGQLPKAQKAAGLSEQMVLQRRNPCCTSSAAS
jgi:hypothetical protein